MIERSPTPSPGHRCPPVIGGRNLGTCGKPDCGGCGVASESRLADAARSELDAVARRCGTFAADPALAAGVGVCGLAAADGLRLDRTSTALHADDPRAWKVGRT